MYSNIIVKEICDEELLLARGVKDLYFVRMIIDSKTGPIKIGVSLNMKSRLVGIQNGNPYEIEVVCIVKNMGCQESMLHAAYSNYRMKGEWFEVNDKLLGLISDIKEWQESPSLSRDIKHLLSPEFLIYHTDGEGYINMMNLYGKELYAKSKNISRILTGSEEEFLLEWALKIGG